MDANLCLLQISDDGQDDRVAYGVSAMQGWRISMEDAHAAVLDLQAEDADTEFKAASVDDRLSSTMAMVVTKLRCSREITYTRFWQSKKHSKRKTSSRHLKMDSLRRIALF